jgi:biotin carboxyl carrier protein
MENEINNKEYQDLNLEGATYKTMLNRKFLGRKGYEPVDQKKLKAFIPGTVMQVFVKDKQRVKKGDKLMVLQAMKMNNIILAPMNGHIKKIHFKKGDVVAKLQVLIELK